MLDDSAQSKLWRTSALNFNVRLFRLPNVLAFLATPGVALSPPANTEDRREEENARKCFKQTNGCESETKRCKKKSHGPCQAMSISILQKPWLHRKRRICTFLSALQFHSVQTPHRVMTDDGKVLHTVQDFAVIRHHSVGTS